MSSASAGPLPLVEIGAYTAYLELWGISLRFIKGDRPLGFFVLGQVLF